MKETIKEILVTNQQHDFSGSLKPREQNIYVGLDKIQAIIGPRRAGKTSIMRLAMEEIKQKKKISPSQIIYFNFEDGRVQFQEDQLDLLLQAWKELYPEASLEEAWFFFDEVQAIAGWERFLNRINETLSKKIVFTGSNSAILQTKIKSVMRGRSIAVELLPLSFREYCLFKQIKPIIYGKDKTKTTAAFGQYLLHGGYPETVNLPQQNIRIAYLQEYYNAMLLRNIIEYNQLSNYQYLRSLYHMASLSIGKTISVRRLFNQLKSMQHQVSVNSVYEAMDLAENAYLFKRISRFDFSGIKRDKSEKKIYWLDNGMLNANTTLYTGNKGLLLENLVFVHLYHKFASIYDINLYYYTDPGSECDFIVYPDGGLPLPIQVSWSLGDPATRQREIKGLLKACAYCRTGEGWIITADEEEELTVEDVKIRVKPAWKWMLHTQ